RVGAAARGGSAPAFRPRRRGPQFSVQYSEFCAVAARSWAAASREIADRVMRQGAKAAQMSRSFSSALGRCAGLASRSSIVLAVGSEPAADALQQACRGPCSDVHAHGSAVGGQKRDPFFLNPSVSSPVATGLLPAPQTQALSATRGPRQLDGRLGIE